MNEFQAVPEFPNVWAAGDGTALLHAKTGTSHPPNAQHGLREGPIAAKIRLLNLRHPLVMPPVSGVVAGNRLEFAVALALVWRKDNSSPVSDLPCVFIS